MPVCSWSEHSHRIQIPTEEYHHFGAFNPVRPFTIAMLCLMKMLFFAQAGQRQTRVFLDKI